jgi:predicted AlkP superfamily phosphohydrolase/phosphomutase
MILFAVDGLEWRVMEPLIESGQLPVMARLMKRGTFGYLESMQPTFSAVIWTSVATGKIPQKHGILHFVYPTSRGGRKEYRYYTSGHRKTKAFWNILSDFDLDVHCIGWWMTYPAEAINGVMVTQTNTTGVLRNPRRALWKGALLKGVEDQVYPPERQNRVMSLLEETDRNLDTITENIFGRTPNKRNGFSQMMWDQAQWAFRADATYVRVARDILETGEPFDLLALYLGGPDVAGHRFWRYAYPDEFDNPPERAQIENFGRIIADHYVYVDRIIGEILDIVPDDTGVLIVSDHGMHAINQDGEFRVDGSPMSTNSAHHLDAPPGVVIAAGGPFRSPAISERTAEDLDLAKMETVGSVLDVLPTLLAIKGIPVGEDMDGTPLRSVIDLDWMERSGIRYVPTHDTEEWLAGRQERIREAVDQTERLEQLRSLGYIK